MSIDNIKVNEDQYQEYADCMRSDQVPAKDMVAIFNHNPKFHEWYQRKYLNGRTGRR